MAPKVVASTLKRTLIKVMAPKVVPSTLKRTLSNAGPAGAAAASATPAVAAIRQKRASSKRRVAAPVNWKTNVSRLAVKQHVGMTARSNIILSMAANELHRHFSTNLHRLRRGSDFQARITDLSYSAQKKRQNGAPMRDTSKLITAAMLTTCAHFPPALVSRMLEAQIKARKAYDASFAASAADKEPVKQKESKQRPAAVAEEEEEEKSNDDDIEN